MNYEYFLKGKTLQRFIRDTQGREFCSEINESDLPKGISLSEHDDYFKRWLQCKKRPQGKNTNGDIRVVDLFCGCGGLSLGIAEACRALEYNFVSVLGADMAEAALDLYKKNFNPKYTIDYPIEELIDSDIGDPISNREKQFLDMVGNVDVLIGGPPCQGNSDLNNHTRRNDPRNLLYLRMIRCAEICMPKYMIIENVPGVQHDTHNVVDIAKEELQKLGYCVDSGVITMSDIGVPQRRKRFFLIAARGQEVSLKRAIDVHKVSEELPIAWAIEDLLDINSNTVFDTPANSSETNKKRIDYLFDNDLYDLPNSERPDCHRLKKHSYTAVYGRMHWDIPSPTITGGFGSNGQGRFVHPKRRRTITPHEAARVQFFPDYFDFNDVKRRELQQIIGNAVPSKASYIVGVEFLDGGEVKNN
ncbi:DNA cytosine methyltransferase [Butyrivibrio sp. WCD2001]|uniref:DNA cytosine methyltransferase n=1 Tax=Butyrivibrio sp. WCD2001 TaxID=1280681 RepID=UPI0004279807|nr:DNA cytosine methyltransferase [Butyrivibrio sp. WCD2001]